MEEPAASGEDPKLYRSFVVLHLLGPVFGLPICASLLTFDNRHDAVAPLLTAGMCLLWLLPFVARSGLRRAAFLSVHLWTAISLFGALFYGGLNSPFAAWLIVATLLGFAYLPQATLRCMGAMILQGLLFLIAHHLWPQAPRLEQGALGALFLASSFAAALYVSLIAAFYSRLKVEGSRLAEMAARYDETACRTGDAIRDMEQEDQRAADFMAKSSHDLRSGLDLVIGYSELLVEDAVVEEREAEQWHLARITASSREMLALVLDGDQLAQPAPDTQRGAGETPADATAEGSPEDRHGQRRTLDLAWLREQARAAAPLLFATALSVTLEAAGVLRPIHAAIMLATFALGMRFAPIRRVPVDVDMLTSLPNRTAFQRELEHRLAPSSRSEAALLFADLNGFKEVNDGLGHDVGDQLLAQVAKRFAAVRPGGVLLARLGGDEFGAAAFGPGSEAAIHGFANAMQDALVEPVRSNEHQLNIGVSIGIAHGRAGQVTGQELLRRSDVAMYRAKLDGRTPVQPFDVQMDEALNFRRTMRNDLAEALSSEDQLDLHLQPVVDARTGELASVEALLRWNHPLLGPVSPAKLITLAEASGHIVDIDDWVLERALRQIKRLGTVPIAINISPVQFRQPGFSRKIVERLAAHAVPAQLLRLEITEGVLVTHTRAADRAMAELREAGLKIALDDFGTGYSSLSYLKDLGVDILKVDRSFITALDQGRQGTELLRAIVDLGHSLSMAIIAEGVETAQQAAVVQLLGGDFIQGYFTGRPMPIDQLEAWMATKAADGRANSSLSHLS
ncbi:bifunctional diguanylate cyclase/phosphodiesterase [uncultured Sphingomonas sp.]|uniref:putative bifunctional diguanylate cyclase/phosphodiesterase n=1 Tax=uncultured Sphingomonas sp. TaxID=158754 RepID=UPI0025D551A6|nr:bifunctional diguanylate cyclase/phosphodiesterase [uncultured Sphingomonas sp.]